MFPLIINKLLFFLHVDNTLEIALALFGFTIFFFSKCVINGLLDQTSHVFYLFAFMHSMYFFYLESLVVATVWQKCLDNLESEFPPQQFNTWLRPLQAEPNVEQQILFLFAPNRFVVDWVKKYFYTRIHELVSLCSDGALTQVSIEIGSKLTDAVMPIKPAEHDAVVPFAVTKKKQ